jgi:hypothetical protein
MTIFPRDEGELITTIRWTQEKILKKTTLRLAGGSGAAVGTGLPAAWHMGDG